MTDYSLTPDAINAGVERVLAQAYAISTVSDNPELVFITGGPGAGKTSIERFIKSEFKSRGDTPFVIGSDIIAEFHPKYIDALEELPEECYRITRQFVRPATPKIFDGLFAYRICIINENTLDKGQPDIDLAKKAHEAGYKIKIAIMATDLFESRASCFERDANELELGKTPRGCSTETQLRMYDGFIPGIKALQEAGLVDGIQVFTRGKTIAELPNLIYSSTDPNFSSIPNFEIALNNERARQRKSLLQNAHIYFSRLSKSESIYNSLCQNIGLREKAIEEIGVLRRDFVDELVAEEQR